MCWVERCGPRQSQRRARAPCWSRHIGPSCAARGTRGSGHQLWQARSPVHWKLARKWAPEARAPTMVILCRLWFQCCVLVRSPCAEASRAALPTRLAHQRHQQQCQYRSQTDEAWSDSGPNSLLERKDQIAPVVGPLLRAAVQMAQCPPPRCASQLPTC